MDNINTWEGIVHKDKQFSDHFLLKTDKGSISLCSCLCVSIKDKYLDKKIHIKRTGDTYRIRIVKIDKYKSKKRNSII